MYRETDFGVIPADWDYAELGPLLAELRNGLTTSQQKEQGAFAVTRIETISQDRINPAKVGYVNGLTHSQIETYSLRAGDILFSHINSDPQIGRSVVFEGEPPGLLHGMNLLLLRVNESQLNPRFLSYLFVHYRAAGIFVKFASRAVNQSSINQGKLKSLRIFLPPLTEQHRIAAVLNTIQDAIAAQEDVIAAAKEFKRSLMHRLFTVGPGREPAPTKETEIGEIPAHWDQKRIEEICTLLQYGTSQRCEIRAAGLPVLRIPNIENGAISLAELKYSEFAAKDIDNFLLRPGDLLFVRTNGRREYAGRCAVYEGRPERALYASYLIRAQFPEDVALPRFVQAFASMPAGARQLSGRAIETADGKFNINTETIRTVAMPVPPIDEQQQIVDQFQIADAKIAAEEDRLTALQALFKSMLHQLMTGQIRLLSDEGLPLA